MWSRVRAWRRGKWWRRGRVWRSEFQLRFRVWSWGGGAVKEGCLEMEGGEMVE
jgi:hypothetical protein